MRAKRWREERQQLTDAIRSSLTDKIYEALNERQMDRTITLLTTSLRRGRHPIGLRELLRAPQDHVDFLVEFVIKRFNLRRLPGAPVPLWQQITDRADKFQEFINGRKLSAISASTRPPETVQSAPAQTYVPATPTIKTGSKSEIDVSDETLVNAMAQILVQCSGAGSMEQAFSEARFRIVWVEQHKKHTAVRTFDRLIKELEPCDFSTNPNELNSQYFEWLIRLAVDIGREPLSTLRALEAALCRAKRMKVSEPGVR
jgi:hypothetical protein